ncbi:MAG: tRNA (adenosine(37)-N6)-threonylcarbamoyltransferase complex dimerization subunit type 1 TsaB [Acidobacteriota bacterium]|nr:tRNA (adenosine(37)-N6)-threonylcarbamoyltransferase complex dimerization subunit type 1 TsaB [Acidobacteriota bacterium]
MLILALDTTTRAGSVALLRSDALGGDAVLYEQSGDPALTHGQRLPGDLIEACAVAGVQISDVELFAVAAGPGSFTGLRIGIATMQGLAMARGGRIVPVSTLEAIAVAAPPGPARIAAWMDAQRGEVFAQVFERGDGRARPLSEAIAARPSDALEHHREWVSGAGFEGDGAVRYRADIERGLGDVRVAAVVPHLAIAIARIAGGSPDRAVLPHAVIPIYVRKPDAEIARDRRAGA